MFIRPALVDYLEHWKLFDKTEKPMCFKKKEKKRPAGSQEHLSWQRRDKLKGFQQNYGRLNKYDCLTLLLEFVWPFLHSLTSI